MHQEDKLEAPCEVESEKTVEAANNCAESLLVHHFTSWRTAGGVSSANVKGAQCRANLILLPDMTLVNISKNVYIFLILYSSGI